MRPKLNGCVGSVNSPLYVGGGFGWLQAYESSVIHGGHDPRSLFGFISVNWYIFRDFFFLTN